MFRSGLNGLDGLLHGTHTLVVEFATGKLPVLDLGGRGVHVPYETTWAMEHATAGDHHDFATLADLSGLPALLAGW